MDQLPRDQLLLIFSELPLADILRCSGINKYLSLVVTQYIRSSPRGFRGLLYRNYRSPQPAGTIRLIDAGHVDIMYKIDTLNLYAKVFPVAEGHVTGLHYTWDGWKTVHKSPGYWSNNREEKEAWTFAIDGFGSMIWGNNRQKQIPTLAFAVYVRTGGHYSWDNNEGENYKIDQKSLVEEERFSPSRVYKTNKSLWLQGEFTEE